MADLSSIPTEELLRMRGASAGADLSQIPTEELLKMRGAPQPTTGEGKPPLDWKAIAKLAMPEAPVDFGLGMVTAPIGAVAGHLAGIVRGLHPDNYGTAAGGVEAKKRGEEVAHELTYQPRKELSQDTMRLVAGLLDKSKLAGLGPNEALMLNQAPLGAALRAGVRPVERAGNTAASLLRKTENEMVGVGAAQTDLAAQLRARAESLPVPVNLSKGEASRDFGQMRFEGETAKSTSAAGDLLRAHSVSETKNIIKNMEWLMDETGAVAPSARGVGTTVDDALVTRRNEQKGKYQAAYTAAREAGEMAAFVETPSLVEWVNKNRSSIGTAPIIKTVEDELVRLGGATRAKDGTLTAGKMSINDIEEMRKRVVKDGQSTASNAHYASGANGVIDAMTEGQGGDLYKGARTMFKEFAGEFKNQGAVRKLLSMKPGTTDRSVAFEDVFKSVVLGGSRDETATVFRTLHQAGAKGEQAVAELKGATIKHLQDELTKNASRDAAGNPVLSYPKLNAAILNLEADGKLEMLFDKKGAQQLRDIAEVASNITAYPPGVLNTSGTGAILKEALGALLTGNPGTAAAKSFKALKDIRGDYKDLQRARDALGIVEGAPPNKTVH